MADNGPITYTIIWLLVITVSTVPTPFPTQKARLSLRRFWGDHSEIKDFGGCRGGGYLTGNWRGVDLQIICTKTQITVKNCQNWITEFKQFTMNMVIIHPAFRFTESNPWSKVLKAILVIMILVKTNQKTQGLGKKRRQSPFHCCCPLGWFAGEHCCSLVEHAHFASLRSDWNALSRCCFDYDEDDWASSSLKTVQSHVSRVNIWSIFCFLCFVCHFYQSSSATKRKYISD